MLSAPSVTSLETHLGVGKKFKRVAAASASDSISSCQSCGNTGQLDLTGESLSGQTKFVIQVQCIELHPKSDSWWLESIGNL